MALAEGGDEVHVISYALPSRLSFINPRIFFHEVVTPTYPLFDNYPPYSLALSTKMVEVARHAPLDVLHVHYAIPNAVSAVMARQILAPQTLPVVTTLHGTDVTLVGNDPERGKGEQYCREHHICGAITFIGSFPLVEEVLVGADLFLLPSESESFGLSALEAMGCEVPVIASRAGGLPEVVVDGETGFLCPVGDVDGMAAAALK